MKKFIIFDVDGTMLHSYPLVKASLNYACKETAGITFDDKTILSKYGKDEEGILMNLLKDKFTNKTFSYFLTYYLNFHDEYIKDFIPGIRDLLEELNDKNIPLYVLSGRSKESLDISLTKLNGFKYFLAYYCGNKNGQHKPENMLKLFKEQHLNKDEGIYIGDTLKDINASKKVGIDIISANFDKTIRTIDLTPYNDKVAKSVNELKELIFDLFDL